MCNGNNYKTFHYMVTFMKKVVDHIPLCPVWSRYAPGFTKIYYRERFPTRIFLVSLPTYNARKARRPINAHSDNLKFGFNEYRMLHDRVSAVSEPKGAALLEGRQRG